MKRTANNGSFQDNTGVKRLCKEFHFHVQLEIQ